MRKRKRQGSPFNLSFLDIMFCGFGAIVLLVMILSGEVLKRRDAKEAVAQEKLDRAELKFELARVDFEQRQAQIRRIETARLTMESQARQLASRIEEARRQTERVRVETRKAQGRIAAITQQQEALAKQQSSVEDKAVSLPKPGKGLVGFTGDGQRQYLTGLKLGGERTLILLDASASMLDETIVNIVRMKLMSPSVRRQAPKWQRAVRSFHWLIANLQAGKYFQAYAFNTQAQTLVAGTDGQWLRTDDSKLLEQSIASARKLTPDNGTSLQNALAVITRLNPPPDSVVLLTDGLPTVGTQPAQSFSVSGRQRLALFGRATSTLSVGIPINTLLFPLEGDPAAAEAFWQLAIKTQGSFITPSRDWP